MRIKIISFAFARNRQGADLAEILSDKGYLVTLYELDETPGTGRGRINYSRIAIPNDILSLDQSNRNIPFALGIYRRVMFLKHALFGRCDVLIAINYESLSIAAIIASLHRSKLVYYPLELVGVVATQKREARYCDRFCDMIIGVEANRLAILKSNLKRDVPSFVVPNAPRRMISTEPRGMLIEYLTKKHDFRQTESVIIYHGVYHKHACLESIVGGIHDWPSHVRLVLMLTGKIPESFKKMIQTLQEKVVFVPPVKHEVLFEWLRDASIGLLPYEDDISLNVRYCSPQKMFDLLACGVPFIGSKRPLIEEVAANSKAGVCIDMTSGAEIAAAIKSLLAQPASLAVMSQNAKKAYEQCYNYDTLVMSAVEHMAARF